jgi:hypothetical protein
MYQFGENQTIEHKWSDNDEVQLSQLYFQLVRSNDLEILESKYRGLLNKKDKNLMPYLYKLIAQTRDITQGKGEYNLSFMLLAEWVLLGEEYLPAVYNALDLFIEIKNAHPYGCWKDLNYFCEYLCIKKAYVTKDYELVDYCCEKIANQLYADDHIDNPTLCAKWAPREHSRFGWMVLIISKKLVKLDRINNLNKNQSIRLYRKTCSRINKKLDTTQIKQCGRSWSDIDFNKVTSITMRKQARAFMYYPENCLDKYNVDRKICSDNYKRFIESRVKGNQTIKGGRVGFYDFVKDALDIDEVCEDEETQKLKQVLNLQWKDHQKQNKKLNNMITMVDVSASMEDDRCIPLYNAIGLGIRISELSTKFKDEIITFTSYPSIVKLDDCDNFVDKVHKVRSIEWGGFTNFEAALDLILEKCVTEKTPVEEVKDIVMCVLSDMQIDDAVTIESKTMFDLIRTKYKTFGYEMPTILFWNLRQTNGFPSTTTQENVIMVSGYNSTLLNAFSEKGIDAFKKITPFKMVKDILNNPRYDLMNIEKFVDNIDKKIELDPELPPSRMNYYIIQISLGILTFLCLRYFLILLIIVM